jgi:hypothetical protein
MVAVMRVADASLANRWSCAECTLNGEPAIIRGRLLRFALVVPLAPVADPCNVPSMLRRSAGPGVEYSWSAVDYVMREKGGEFRY